MLINLDRDSGEQTTQTGVNAPDYNNYRVGHNAVRGIGEPYSKRSKPDHKHMGQHDRSEALFYYFRLAVPARQQFKWLDCPSSGELEGNEHQLRPVFAFILATLKRCFQLSSRSLSAVGPTPSTILSGSSS
jgi:hypothetical protein